MKIKEHVLRVYFLLSYFFLLVNSSRYLTHVSLPSEGGVWVAIFAGVVWLVYTFLYMLPSVLVVGIAKLCTKNVKVIYSLAIVSVALAQSFIFGDYFLFDIYNYHFNGFVWNIIITPGGIESLGATPGTIFMFSMMIASLFVLQTILLVVSAKWKHMRDFFGKWLTRKYWISFAVIWLLVFGIQSLIFGFCHFYKYAPILRVGDDFFFYQPLTVKSLAKKLKLEEPSSDMELKISSKDSTLKYPISEIKREEHKKYNIVWLTAESWRWDTLNKELMPQSFAFAEESAWFTNHYSSGNGTRMAMFGLFYGIYANYWFSFLNENRGPVLMDWLIADNYQFGLYTSARFTYPEFNKTVFARFSKDQLHEETQGESWERDRKNVNRMLGFIETRDKERPFMTFMFFESPHAPYQFPPENAIKKPYLEDMNYATMNLDKDMSLIKNRYDNSVNHLDGQIGKIVEYLKKHDLMDSTIIILCGDHGEEFGEKGDWGHNSTYAEEQTRPPLVIWYPGVTPQVYTKLTSHLDVPATLAKFLGVKNSPSDYSFGFDLFGNHEREYTIMGDWNNLCYVDEEYKAVLPINMASMAEQDVDEKDDEPADRKEFYRRRAGVLSRLMQEIGRFYQK